LAIRYGGELSMKKEKKGHPRLRELLPLANPIILASGPPGRNAKSLIKYGQTAGAVVAKSVTWKAQEGNPQPRITRVKEWGMINWENLPNPGYLAFCRELEEAKAVAACPVIGSIGPLESVEQQRTIAAAFEEAGADAIELDFKWGARFSGSLIQQITHAVKEAVSIPVIAKLAPFVGDIVENALAVEEAGADAVTAINSVYPAMRIDCRLRRPAITSGIGGLSGQPILPLAVAMVYQVYEAVDIPIIGCGGIVTGEDALELIMAGAEAVQTCTAAMIEGPEAFTRINAELEELLAELGLESVEAGCGLAHDYPLHVPEKPQT
jgi:dihydroorotate dehydrogenase (NAD+) catalytic subunit